MHMEHQRCHQDRTTTRREAIVSCQHSQLHNLLIVIPTGYSR
jgi:hypothetical protein